MNMLCDVPRILKRHQKKVNNQKELSLEHSAGISSISHFIKVHFHDAKWRGVN